MHLVVPGLITTAGAGVGVTTTGVGVGLTTTGVGVRVGVGVVVGVGVGVTTTGVVESTGTKVDGFRPTKIAPEGQRTLTP